MKYIATILAATLAIACQSDIDEGMGIGTNRESALVLNISGGELGIDTRAEDIADTASESAVAHLDVMIFNDDADKSLFYHERVTTADANGQVRLGVDINQIVVDAKYWVYVVANSTMNENTYANIGNVSNLFNLKEECHNVHLTASGLNNTTSHFLMDGAAYMGNTEPATATAITIAEAPIKDIVELRVTLRRAAAKVVVKLLAEGDIEFSDSIEDSSAGYYVSNMPYVTRVMDDKQERKCEQLETTTELMCEQYFKWMRAADNSIEGVEITLYVFSHSWDTSDSFSYATNLLVDIPAYYTSKVAGVTQTKPHAKNYYQVPMTKDFSFKRNHYYEVVAAVHAPGAEDFSEPVEVRDLKYSVLPWTEYTINVGGQIGPQYLTVNQNELKMFNTDEDSTSLLFSSSSPVTIEVTECYYIDKFGIRINLDPERYNISGTTANGAISGNITVRSDNPTNNTIRYFTLLVTNQTGETEIVYVKQYPLIFIVNVLGYYSYREDFKSDNADATTYVNKGSRIVTLSLDQFSNGKWSYEYGTTPGDGFWSSKVTTADYGENDRDSYKGRSKIQYYYWTDNGSTPNVGVRNNSNATTDNPGNARMYHICITATSGDYNIGTPRMVSDGSQSYTDSDDDNAQLVSPSFMTASRLGKVDIQNYGYGLTNDERRYAMARDHCANYVEVDRDNNVYSNWRLPTASELQIIIDLQGSKNESADAIDYLLDADYYMSASGLVYNEGRSNTGNPNQSVWAIRCIRDVYDKDNN